MQIKQNQPNYCHNYSNSIGGNGSNGSNIIDQIVYKPYGVINYALALLYPTNQDVNERQNLMPLDAPVLEGFRKTKN